MTDSGSMSAVAVARDRLVFGAVAAASVVVLFVPTAPGVPPFPYADKVIHLLLFTALAWTACRAGLGVRACVLGLVAYAALSELVQAILLPSRSGSWLDLAADVLGVGLGIALNIVLDRAVSRAGRHTMGP